MRAPARTAADFGGKTQPHPERFGSHDCAAEAGTLRPRPAGGILSPPIFSPHSLKNPDRLRACPTVGWALSPTGSQSRGKRPHRARRARSTRTGGEPVLQAGRPRYFPGRPGSAGPAFQLVSSSMRAGLADSRTAKARASSPFRSRRDASAPCSSRVFTTS